jgi:hypothetical protein
VTLPYGNIHILTAACQNGNITLILWRKISMPSSKHSGNSFRSFFGSLKNIIRGLIAKVRNLFPSSHIYFLAAAIYIFKAIQPLLPSSGSETYLDQFIERFGVIYGILLPLILVRAWEQLDELDRVFDKEADAVKTFYDELFFLRDKDKSFLKNIMQSLQEYVSYVIDNYQDEVKKTGRKAEEKIKGDKILDGIMQELKNLFRTGGLRTKGEEAIIPRLIDKLNDIIDLRGDRIGIASQRLFESLHIVALITSIIFIIPFYFDSFLPTQSLFVLENLLTVAVTLLVVIIFVLIEDLDEPFYGSFKIDADSWQRILSDMNSFERRRELENIDQPSRKDPWRSREIDKKKKTVRKTLTKKIHSKSG